VRHWFTRLDIQGWADKKVEELSKGMQQKVQFACTVLHRPDLIILDEPFSGFDPVNSEVLKQEILNLQRKGATLLFSTHRMDTVEEMCQDVALINRAKVVLSGETTEIRARYSDRSYLIRHEGSLSLPERGVELLPPTAGAAQGTSTIAAPAPGVPTHNSVAGEPGIQQTRVRLIDGALNDLLAHCITQGTPLYAVEEIRPGFHEIFIKTVKETES
jgi:ABC-2 type transport system ATP-binding protein